MEIGLTKLSRPAQALSDPCRCCGAKTKYALRVAGGEWSQEWLFCDACMLDAVMDFVNFSVPLPAAS